ncbi:MAG: hypothetical protein IPG78_15235 [Ignavibacteria bacterium]|nr:hypothetical protein [Ignavibacteria bacterium]
MKERIPDRYLKQDNIEGRKDERQVKIILFHCRSKNTGRDARGQKAPTRGKLQIFTRG